MPIQPSFTTFSLLTTPDFCIFLATKLSSENRYVRQHLQECEPWRCGSNFVSMKRTNLRDKINMMRLVVDGRVKRKGTSALVVLQSHLWNSSTSRAP